MLDFPSHVNIFSTVPSVDSSIPVTIQPVVIGNMVEITVLVNVRKGTIVYTYIISVYHNCVCKT